MNRTFEPNEKHLPLTLTLAVNPIPQQRARVTFGKRGVHAYTPPRTAAYYDTIQWALKAAGVRKPLAGLLDVKMRFWRNCRGLPGDATNLAKAVEDASNGFLWEDDRQIRRLEIELIEYGPRIQGKIEIEIHPYTPTARNNKGKEVTVTT